MAKKDIEVNTDTLKSVHSNASDEFGEGMQAQLKAMLAEVEGLNDVWEGPNHTNFVELFETEKLELKSFNKAAEAFLKAWEQARDAYMSCESSVSKLIK